MKCPECPKTFSDSDGAVTHLTNSHGLSRIEARREVVGRSSSSKGSEEDGSTAVTGREEMLEKFRRLYERRGGLPTPYEVDKVDGYSYDDYLAEFGSVFGTAVHAGKTETDPEEYEHSTDSKQQYSEWDLISEIWRLYDQTGNVSSRMMDSVGKYSDQTYRYRFGSWSQALEKAKIDGPEPSVQATREPRAKHYARKEWKELRKQALERDEYQCQSCDMSESENQDEFGVGLNVHHLTDIDEFDDPRDADTIENLETLCSRCHGEKHPFSKD